MGDIVEFRSNGGTASGYLAVPTAGSGPGVVVIQEWWGLVDHIKDVCERFADEGFVALAPDLYHGRQVDEPDEAAKAMMALRLDQAGRDMSGAVDAVAERSSSTSVGVVGFCMGGGLALVLACQRPDRVGAVVPFYGLVPWDEVQPDYAAMTAAVQGHYAGHDDFAGPPAAEALEQRLRDLGREVEMFLYPDASHAFFNDTGPSYDPEASEQAWQRATAFLRDRLG
ncbi:MAG: dienelactone hydrolase family protein [Actinomycetota bacterium]|nr:dienelactone hydrolase family protein [Actinomycetota bacterium]